MTGKAERIKYLPPILQYLIIFRNLQYYFFTETSWVCVYSQCSKRVNFISNKNAACERECLNNLHGINNKWVHNNKCCTETVSYNAKTGIKISVALCRHVRAHSYASSMSHHPFVKDLRNKSQCGCKHVFGKTDNYERAQLQTTWAPSCQPLNTVVHIMLGFSPTVTESFFINAAITTHNMRFHG